MQKKKPIQPVILITGAARRIGAVIARLFHGKGYKIIIHFNQSAAEADRICKSLNNLRSDSCFLVQSDLNKPEGIDKIVDLIESIGRLDILVNNAGCNIRKPAMDVRWEDWNTILDTNLRGMFFMTQRVAESMLIRQRGRVINIGSVTSVFGYAGLGPYCASRGGVKQLTMSMADEFGPHGITVNCLAPGWFRTAQNDVLYQDKEWLEYLVDRIPLRRPGKAEDLDGAVVFLASDASSYVTGQTLLVDGGISTGATRAMPRSSS